MPENKEIINSQNEQIVRQPTERPTEIMRDLQKDQEAFVPREVRSWMEKVEKNPSLNNQGQKINGDDDSVLQSIAPAVTKIVLPVDRKNFSEGFNKTMDDAGRWLSEFVFRLIKKNKGNVKFKEE
ncbi:MAG: hypothetical protein PHP97_00900 [Candidatus Shapirobacteria bacterium]|nr:hypothetical protein [Candidatus Shapirobacteria bacterium]MDD3003023.1 hypothetical protein [Candidatus Shapirobacteria bacterium]MDD4383396.1 hypothetical protein [Candidatus Shapirobacteria bacterium]